MGCTKVSPACDHCYAERDTRRFGRVEWGAGKPRVRTSVANWKQVERWNRTQFYQCGLGCNWRGEMPKDSGGNCPVCKTPYSLFIESAKARRRVFCASLADWLDNEVPIEWLVDLLDLIRRTPNLDWLQLTKRIGNWRARLDSVLHAIGSREEMPALWDWTAHWLDGNAPTNVWLGATVVNQAEADRDVPKLLQVPARVRFLSIEPMLGPVDLTAHLWGRAAPCDRCTQDADCECGYAQRREITDEPAIDWIIAGGESGPHARPLHPDWIRSLRDECAAAGVPFLFKQWGEFGEFVNEEHYTHGGEEKHAHAWVDRSTGEHGKVWLVDDDGMWSNWTGDPRSADIGGLHDDIAVVGRHGKKAAGRKLDGREHNGFPAVQP